MSKVEEDVMTIMIECKKRNLGLKLDETKRQIFHGSANNGKRPCIELITIEELLRFKDYVNNSDQNSKDLVSNFNTKAEVCLILKHDGVWCTFTMLNPWKYNVKQINI
jgi:hypothetical protein